MGISRSREKRKGFLLLFGSQVIGKGRKNSDYDFLMYMVKVMNHWI